MTYQIMGDLSVKRNLSIVQYNETVNAISATSGSITIDLNLGSVVSVTGTSSITWTVTNVPASGKAASFTLVLVNGGTGTQTWMSGIKWSSATAPTLQSSGTDILTFFTINGGTTWYGALALGAMG